MIDDLKHDLFDKDKTIGDRLKGNESISISDLLDLNGFTENDISNEAYYGADSKTSLRLSAAVANLKSAAEGLAKGKMKSNSITVKNAKVKWFNTKVENHAKVELEKVCKVIAEEFNVETVQIVLTDTVGETYTLPKQAIPIDYFLKVSTNKRGIGTYDIMNNTPDKAKKRIRDALNVTFAKDGVKFTNKKGSLIFIAIGIPILTSEVFSSDDVCSIILHEIGHNFQYVIDSVADKEIQSALNHAGLGIFMSSMNLGNFVTMMIASAAKGMDSTTLGVGILGIVLLLLQISNVGILSDAVQKSGEGSKKQIVDLMTDIMTARSVGDSLESVKSYFAKVKSDTNGTIGESTIVPFIVVFISTISIIGMKFATGSARIYAALGVGTALKIALLAPQHLYASINAKQFAKVQSSEQFADMFASMYGFNMASGLSSLGKKIRGGENALAFMLNPMNILMTLHPGLGVLSTFNNFLSSSLLAKTETHGSTSDRMLTQYQFLKRELAKNKDLSKSQKEEMLTTMKSIKNLYKCERYDDFRAHGLDGLIVKTIYNNIVMARDKGKIDSMTVENEFTKGFAENVERVYDEVAASGGFKSTTDETVAIKVSENINFMQGGKTLPFDKTIAMAMMRIILESLHTILGKGLLAKIAVGAIIGGMSVVLVPVALVQLIVSSIISILIDPNSKVKFVGNQVETAFEFMEKWEELTGITPKELLKSRILFEQYGASEKDLERMNEEARKRGMKGIKFIKNKKDGKLDIASAR